MDLKVNAVLVTTLTVGLIFIPVLQASADTRPQVRVSKKSQVQKKTTVQPGFCYVEKQRQLSKAEETQRRVKKIWGVKVHKEVPQYELVACSEPTDYRRPTKSNNDSYQVLIGTLIGTRG